MRLGLVLLGPLHHGDVGADANIVDRFLASDGAVFIATFMHTFGALLFTAGLALYLYEAWRVKHVTGPARNLTLSLLPLAHAANVLGIGMNGLGGLMRLYQPDHPGLESLQSSLWVQVLLVKHVFLAAGIGAALWLTVDTMAIARHADAIDRFANAASRIRWVAIGSFATILIASVLGSVASMQPIGDDAAAGMQPPGGINAGEDPNATRLRYANATGTITGTPVMPGRATTDIDVPADATELFVELKWSANTAVLDLTVQNSAGAQVAGTRTASATRITFTQEAPLVPGGWKLVVVAERAVNEPYVIVGRVTSGPLPNSLELTCIASSRAGAFAEVNLNMTRGQRFDWSWEVVNDPLQVAFNIHVHAGGQTKYLVQGNWNRHGGTYVHNETDTNAASLMWDNNGDHDVRVHFRIVGEFEYWRNSPC